MSSIVDDYRYIDIHIYILSFIVDDYIYIYIYIFVCVCMCVCVCVCELVSLNNRQILSVQFY